MDDPHLILGKKLDQRVSPPNRAAHGLRSRRWQASLCERSRWVDSGWRGPYAGGRNERTSSDTQQRWSRPRQAVPYTMVLMDRTPEDSTTVSLAFHTLVSNSKRTRYSNTTPMSPSQLRIWQHTSAAMEFRISTSANVARSTAATALTLRRRTRR